MPTIFSLLTALFAQWIVIFYPGVLVFWLLIHTRIERWRRIGTKAYWVALSAWLLTATPLLYFRSELFSVRWPPIVAMELAGLIAFFLALVFGWEASKIIPLRTLVGLPELEPHKNKQPLMNTGIYAKTRNPIYFAHWLLVFSAAALTSFAANWVMFASDCVVLPLMIRTEERELLGRDGSEFADYMRRVPRFFPKLT